MSKELGIYASEDDRDKGVAAVRRYWAEQEQERLAQRIADLVKEKRKKKE
jgi:hypothetical protein